MNSKHSKLFKLIILFAVIVVACGLLVALPSFAAAEGDDAVSRIEGETYIGDDTAANGGLDTGALDDDYGIDTGELEGAGVSEDDLIEISDYAALANSFRFKDGRPIESSSTDDGAGVSLLANGWPSGAKYWGIDVSEWDYGIDWTKVKNAGVSFAIIRCGYGTAGTDKYLLQNVQGALSAGIKIGIYLYSYAYSYSSAYEEAQWCLSLMSKAGLNPSKLSMPVYYDMENEYNGRPAGRANGKYYYNSNSTLTDMAKAWATVIGDAGYEVGYYANLNWWRNFLNDSFFNGYERWVAQYNSSCTYTGSYQAWQYTSEGRVDGIKVNCDLNYYYKEFGIDVTELETMDLSDGSYYINSVARPSASVDIKNGSTQSGAITQLYQGNQTEAQQFELISQGDGSYVIKNVKSGLVLDVQSGSAYAGATVQQYAANGTTAQKWYIRNSGNGWYIQTALGNYVLDLASGLTSNGTQVRLYKPNSTDAQKFVMASVGSELDTQHAFEIEAAGETSLVLDIESGSKNNGARAQIYAANDTDAQRFVFTKIGNGVYSIKNANSDKMIEVASGLTATGSAVSQYDSNSTLSQYWSVINYGDSGYSFIGVRSGKALDITSAVLKSGSKVQIWTPNASTAQLWKLVQKPTQRDALNELAAANKDILAEGTYTIATSKDTAKVLDVASGSLTSGANVQLYAANKTSAQRWRITKDSAGYITITNENSGKVLDVYSGTASNGANVWQYDSNGTYAQKWIAVKDATGIKLVSAINKNFVLDIASGSTSNGANVQIYNDNGTAAQRFIFTQEKQLVADGTYTVKSVLGNKLVLDVSSGSKDNGANVQIWAGNDTAAQKWQITNNADGSVSIINVGSHKALDVSGGLSANGTNVWQYSANGTNAQKWFPSSDGNGNIVLHSALDRTKVLDVASGSAKSGANVQIYAHNGSSAQKWAFEVEAQF